MFPQGIGDPAEAMIAAAEAQLETTQAALSEARSAVSELEMQTRKWERVISTLRPPTPTEKRERASALAMPTTRQITDEKLDEKLELLRAHFSPTDQFLTRDAAEVLNLNPSYAVKMLQEMRLRGDVRLAGRAPGKGVIPLFALVPVRPDEPQDEAHSIREGVTT